MAARKARRGAGRAVSRYHASAGTPARVYGAYAWNEPYPLDPHYALETLVTRSLPIMSWFTGWNSFMTTEAVTAKNGGYSILYCWEATNISFADINAGVYDAFITTWMTDAKNSGADITIRLFHEMNGNWYTWAVADASSYVTSTAQWISAWQRIVGIRNTVVAPNVKFLFCANANDGGGVTMESYWPGDAWVDLVGIDGYAWGPGSTFTSTYQDMYNRFRALAPSKTDIRIGEIGTDGSALNAAQDLAWWTDFYDTTTMPLITRVCFFHKDQFALNYFPGTLALHTARMGDVAAGSTPLADLVDDFSGTLALWPTLYGATTAIVGGRARMSVDAAYTGIRSAAAYRLAGSQFHVRVYAPAAGGATTDANTAVRVESGTDGTFIGIEVNRATGNISFQSMTGYSDPNAVAVTYDPVAHAWWRIREAAGNLFWETSPDGITWTNRRTTNTATPAWVTSSTTVGVQFAGHRNNGTNDYAEFDDVNIAGTAPPAVITNLPAQPALVAYGASSGASLAAYAQPGAMVIASRGGYDSATFQSISAAGGHVLIYMDAIVHNTTGRYHDLLFNSSVYGAAVPKWPGPVSANSTGDLADFRVGGLLLTKLPAILELMVTENPHMAGFFADDCGSRSWFPNFNWDTWGSTNQSAYRAGAIAIAQIFHDVAQAHGLITMVNGTWNGGTLAAVGGGYPTLGTHGCSLAEGGCVEHHDGEISYWGPYVGSTSQWGDACAIGHGKPFCFGIMAGSAGLTEFNSDNRHAWLVIQNDYSTYPAPWTSFHPTGLATNTSG